MIPSTVISTDTTGSKAARFMEGAGVADVPAAVIVSVELTEFAPGVTEVEEKAQLGTGAGPASAQVS